MNEKEILEYIRQNGLDCCPECGNSKGNEINYDPKELADDDLATFACAKCGLGWSTPRPEE
jgi:hypothetical protein